METYRFCYVRGNWHLENDGTGAIVEIYRNLPKADALKLAHDRVAKRTGMLKVCVQNGKVLEVIELPSQESPLKESRKNLFFPSSLSKQPNLDRGL